jgi:hypothetical protein
MAITIGNSNVLSFGNGAQAPFSERILIEAMKSLERQLHVQAEKISLMNWVLVETPAEGKAAEVLLGKYRELNTWQARLEKRYKELENMLMGHGPFYDGKSLFDV